MSLQYFFYRVKDLPRLARTLAKVFLFTRHNHSKSATTFYRRNLLNSFKKICKMKNDIVMLDVSSSYTCSSKNIPSVEPSYLMGCGGGSLVVHQAVVQQIRVRIEDKKTARENVGGDILIKQYFHRVHTKERK
jgi:hypothetical protein